MSDQVANLLHRLDVGHDMNQVYGLHVKYGQSNQVTSLDKAISHVREVAASIVFKQLIKSIKYATSDNPLGKLFFQLHKPSLDLVEDILNLEGKYGPIHDQLVDLEHCRGEVIHAKSRLLKNCYFDGSIMMQGPMSFALVHVNNLNIRNEDRKKIMQSVITVVEGLVHIMDAILWLICNLPERAQDLKQELELNRMPESSLDSNIYPEMRRRANDLIILFQVSYFNEGRRDLLLLRNKWSMWINSTSIPSFSHYVDMDLSNFPKVKAMNPYG